MHTSEETQSTPTQVLTHSNPTPESASTHKAEPMNQEPEMSQAQTPQIRLPKAQQSLEGAEKGSQTKSFKTDPFEPTRWLHV